MHLYPLSQNSIERDKLHRFGVTAFVTFHITLLLFPFSHPPIASSHSTVLLFYNWQRRLTPVHPPFEDTKKSLRSEDFLALRLFRFIRFIFLSVLSRLWQEQRCYVYLLLIGEMRCKRPTNELLLLLPDGAAAVVMHVR